MKKLVVLLLLCLCTAAVSAGSFEGKTRHRPIKRMSRAEVHRAEKGIPMYTRYNGKVYKNSRNGEDDKTKGGKLPQNVREVNTMATKKNDAQAIKSCVTDPGLASGEAVDPAKASNGGCHRPAPRRT